jgi:hypothetical protein
VDRHRILPGDFVGKGGLSEKGAAKRICRFDNRDEILHGRFGVHYTGYHQILTPTLSSHDIKKFFDTLLGRRLLPLPLPLWRPQDVTDLIPIRVKKIHFSKQETFFWLELYLIHFFTSYIFFILVIKLGRSPTRSEIGSNQQYPASGNVQDCLICD